MNYLTKAALSASALMMASQAMAADFILSGNSGNVKNSNFSYVTGSNVAATIKNSPNDVPIGTQFTDRFVFAVDFLAALGSGQAGSNQRINLDFITDGGLTISAFSLADASAVWGFDAKTALQAAFNANSYDTFLNTYVTPYLDTPGKGTLIQKGTYKLDGDGAKLQLNSVPLYSDNFYVVTVTGTKVTGSGVYTGDISASAVPEPATWAMLLVGFGAVGYAMRRRRAPQSVKVSFA